MPGLRDLLTRPSLILFPWRFSSQAGMLVLSPILPDVIREFGISSATAGRLRPISGATGGLTAILLAVMPRRPGLRDLLSAGPAFVALATLVLVRLRPMEPARGGPAKPSEPRGHRTRRTSRPPAVQMATWSCRQPPEPNP